MYSRKLVAKAGASSVDTASAADRLVPAALAIELALYVPRVAGHADPRARARARRRVARALDTYVDRGGGDVSPESCAQV
eukprot:COSAG02_NODE_603_length_19693_cov_3.883944_9_plen_80_part_00